MLVTLICSPLTTMGSALVLRRDGRPEPIAAANNGSSLDCGDRKRLNRHAPDRRK